MSPSLVIEFDSPSNSYYAGTTVTGRVIFNADKPKKARGIMIKFEGSAHVSWSKSETVRKDDNTSHTQNVDYHADEEYFSSKYYLVGSANSEIEIPAGSNVYQFSTTLPPQLPTSFEGEHGHVRYTIKVNVDRPWKMDFKAESIFTVITPVDLNFIALAKEQVKSEVEKYFCCCCCKSGPLTLVAWIPHKGYVPGQDIPLTIEIDNASNVVVDNVECKLKKVLKWTARLPSTDTKNDYIDLLKLSLEGVEQYGSRTWTQNLTMPQMPFVNLDACSIIDVSFSLKVQATVGGCHKNLSTEIPLMLGTVPISEGQPPPMNQEQNNWNQFSTNGAQTIGFSPPTFPAPGIAVPYQSYQDRPAPPYLADPPPAFNPSVVPPYPTSDISPDKMAPTNPAPYPSAPPLG